MASAVCINKSKKEILLVLNADPKKPLGFWGLPGGKMKNKETAEIGVIRELYQETNQEGKVLKYRMKIPKIGSDGEYIHHFIAAKIVSREKELKNYEDSKAIPKWIPLHEIIAGRIKMFRGHILGLIMILEKMAEEKETDKNGIRIFSDGSFLAMEMLVELKNAFYFK